MTVEAPAVETPATKAPEAPKGEVSQEAQKRFLEDIAKWKSNFQTTKEELETVKTHSEKEKQELTSKVESTAKERQMYEEKYVHAEIKAQAVAAGIKDIDFVKLIDTAEVKIDDKGNVIGIDKAIADLKTKKPDWFGSERKASSSTNAPFADKETKTTPKHARDMSPEEWAKHKPAYMAGKF